MASPWHADAFFVGRAIAARLVAEVPGVREARLADDIPGDEKQPRQPVSVAVSLADADPAASNGLTPVATLEQVWLVTLAVRSAASAQDKCAAKAGPLIPAIVKALHGWRADGASRPLAWASTGAQGPVSWATLPTTR